MLVLKSIFWYFTLEEGLTCDNCRCTMITQYLQPSELVEQNCLGMDDEGLLWGGDSMNFC